MAMAITSIVVLAFVIPLAVLVRSIAQDRAINRATTAAYSLSGPVSDMTDRKELARAVGQAEKDSEGVISLILPDENNTVIGTRPREVDPSALQLARDGQAFARNTDGGADVFVPVVVPDITDGTVRTTVIRVFVPSSALHKGVVAAWTTLGSLGVLLVGIAALVGDRMGRSITRPLREASEVAERLADGDLNARADTEGTPEVTAVATALNLLAERIGELLQAERESVADLSHKLRTPMTALRLATEQVGDDHDRAQLNVELDRLEESLTNVIRQARVPISHDVGADLVTAVRDRMAFWAVLGQAQGREVSVRLSAPTALVKASRHDLDAVIDALVGNVFHHTPSGKPCTVSVERVADGTRLVVDDAGPGLPSSDVAARGRRGPRSRGTGLGLDIARRVAQRSGGEIELGRSPQGGARVCVVLGRSSPKNP